MQSGTSSGKRIALVTGGNKGIGFEVCRQLAQKGLRVVLSARNPERGSPAAQVLRNEGLEVDFHKLDVTSVEDIEAIFSDLMNTYKRVDVLVNNAGVFIDSAEDLPDAKETSIFHARIETIQESIETNTYGALRLCQRFIPQMLDHGYGRVVNVSSGMSQLSEMNGKWPGYRISKVALNAVTRIFSDEIRADEIRANDTRGSSVLINSACPGWVRTDMGGPNAELSPSEGADTIVWLATLPEGGPSGGFFRERSPIEW